MLKYQIITYGCQMNKSDSQRIAAILEKYYKSASKINEADLVLVNMCSVRQSAVDRVYGLGQKFKKLKSQNPRLKTVLTGCILKEDRKKFAKIFDLILNISEVPNLPKYLFYKSENSLPKEKNYLKIKPKYQNNFLAYIPISNGCNNFCSYCVVPYTRGTLLCRSYKDILAEIKEALKKGAKEIWLLGQNVNDYQDKIKMKNQKPIQLKRDKTEDKTNSQRVSKIINFTHLIKMVNDIPGDFKFFFTSPHPKNFSDELISALTKCEKFGKYLNLPVQSGDDEILKKMNRNYTVKDYKRLIKKIRESIPGIKISTDIIVGFPGEIKKQFKNTLKLFKEVKFDYAYIAKYSPRPGTVAFKMKDDVPLKEKKDREKILRNILNK